MGNANHKNDSDEENNIYEEKKGKINLAIGESGNYQFTLPPLKIKNIFDGNVILNINRRASNDDMREVEALYERICDEARFEGAKCITITNEDDTETTTLFHRLIKSSLVNRLNKHDIIDRSTNPILVTKITQRSKFSGHIKAGDWIQLTVEIKWLWNDSRGQMVTEILEGKKL